jgi:hypothetical protein
MHVDSCLLYKYPTSIQHLSPLPGSSHPNQTVGMFLFLVCNDCVFKHDY